MKKILFILFLFAGYLAGAQQITYTPMTAGGYQIKYLKSDSGGIAIPFGDTAIGRGTNRPGSLVCFTGDSLVYRWDGLRWHLFADGDNGTVLDTTFRWSVLDSLNTPPGSPATGDVYEVGTVPTGAWVGHAREIATWGGSAWTFETANPGDLLYNVANDLVSKFNGTNWIRVGKAAIHQGGDRYATNIFVGPLDNFSFTVKTNNVDRFQISNTGAVIFKNLSGVGNALMGLTSAGTATRIASIDSILVPALHSQTYYDLRYLQNITGLVTAGTNVTVTGTGTSGSPYVINSSGGGGSGIAVDTIWREPGEDSIKFSIAGRLRSIKDSSGGVHFSGAGVDSVILYSNTICIYYTTEVDTCFMLDKAYTHVTRNHDTTMYLAYNGGRLIDSFQIYYTKIFAGTNMVIRDTTLPSGETGYILDASGGGGGGSGTVTSISQGFGITNTPNPIETIGTIAADTSVAGLSSYYVRLGEGYWSTIGNSAIDTLTNFLGTIDQKPLIFRVHNQTSGMITDSLARNNGIGYAALRTAYRSNPTAVVTGTGNNALGSFALAKVTSGNTNMAIGGSTLSNLTTGSSNVGVGSNTLNALTTQSENIAIGANAQQKSTGSQNIAIGPYAMGTAGTGASGQFNVAIGYNAMFNATTPQGNVAVGRQALEAMTTGGTSAADNTAVGTYALTVTTSYHNTGIGAQALFSNTSGNENVALGYGAEQTSQTSINNTSIGARARLSAGSGSYNTALGVSANQSGGTGATGLYLGAFAGSANTASNKLFINASQAAATNHLIHGDFSTKQVQINSVTTPVLKASAALEVISTTMGFLPPVMTATQASAISSPAEGLLVYVTDTNGTFASKGWWGYNGAAWEKLNN